MATKILWGVLGLALASVFFALLSMIDAVQSGDEGARSATFGFLFVAALLGVPSGIGLVRARAASRHEKLLSLIAGYVASRDAIGMAKLAQAVGRNELEAEALLLELVEAKRVDLVFHRSREEYLHRARIGQAHQFLEHCDSCGAKLRAQVVFEGESSACEYCSAPLTRKLT